MKTGPTHGGPPLQHHNTDDVTVARTSDQATTRRVLRDAKTTLGRALSDRTYLSDDLIAAAELVLTAGGAR